MFYPRFKRMSLATILVLAFATSQVFLNATLAGPRGNANGPAQQATAILVTSGNKPISVNGANAISDATILTGAAIETPDNVEATINLPGHFSLEIDQNAKLTIEFNSNGIKVTLIRGCVELHTKKGTSGEIVNQEGRSLGKSDPARDGKIDTCERRAPLAIIGAASAGAAVVTAILVGRGKNVSSGSPEK